MCNIRKAEGHNCREHFCLPPMLKIGKHPDTQTNLHQNSWTRSFHNVTVKFGLRQIFLLNA